MLFLVSCESDLKALEQITFQGEVPQTIYTDFEITYTDSGKAVAKVTGDTLLQFSQNDRDGGNAKEVMNGNVHLWFYDNSGEVSSELTSQKATRLSEEDLMIAEGDVIVFNERGERLNTEELIWDAKTEQIRSYVPVKITKKDQILYGDSLVSDQEFLNYEIMNPRGEFIYEED
jgi:LPS export ABC transporter protein LptC